MININSTGTPQQTYKTFPPSEGKNRYLKYYYHLKNYVQIGVRPLPYVRLGFEVLVYLAIFTLRSRMSFVS